MSPLLFIPGELSNLNVSWTFLSFLIFATAEREGLKTNLGEAQKLQQSTVEQADKFQQQTRQLESQLISLRDEKQNVLF